MKDLYKDAMDAIKAPDALVEKTLKLMLEEHKKLEMKAGADAGFEEIKATPTKTRWMTHVALPVAACLCLLMIAPRLVSRQAADVQARPVETHDIPSLVMPTHGAHATEAVVQTGPAKTHAGERTQSIVEALAIDNLATRSGPATEYRETGTYPMKGEYVRLVSLAYDENDIGWVQCEVLYGNKLRRVYTGLQRFDAATFDLGSVPEEAPLDHKATAAATSKAMYGPGEGYGVYDELTVDEGQAVAIIIIENEYAQVEWTTSLQSYRAWVPIRTLRLQ